MFYKDFKPTKFDNHIELEEREDWVVVPCGHNRDSSTFAESNFHSALKLLGGESETVEVHRFGHWANGWFEIILVHPSLQASIDEIEASLANYPVLDDDDLSERESNDADEAWDAWAAREVRKLLVEEFGLVGEVVEWFNDERLFSLYNDHTSGTEHSNEGPHFPTSWLHPLTRNALAQWIRECRKREKEYAQSKANEANFLAETSRASYTP